MIKKFLTLAVIATMMISCNNPAKEQKTEEVKKVTQINPDEFFLVVEELVDQPIEIKGTVVHVCEHGGKRMFIVGDSTDTRVKIVPGADMEVFNVEWVGSEIFVEGVVTEQRIDEQYLNDWEVEASQDATKAEREVAHSHNAGEEHEHDDGSVLEETMKKIENFREEIKASGTDHLSYYSITAKKHEIK